MNSTMNISLKLALLIVVLLVPALSVSARHTVHKKESEEELKIIRTPGIQADTIYYNGTLITVDEKQTIAEAIALKDYLILAVGSNSDILKFKGPNTNVINLAGKTVLPGFYDAHSHFMLNSLQSDQGFDLSPPPIGHVTKIQHIIDNVREHIEKTQPPAGKTILGIGYSDIALEENRHPNKHDLDQIATDRPILMLHSSMHIMAVNSYALAACNLTYQTLPQEMKEMFVSVDGELTGVVKETGLMMLGSLIKPILANETILENGFSDYYEMGFTTAHDVLFTYSMGYIFKNSHTDYRNVTSHYFPINIDAYLMVSSVDAKASWIEALKTKKDNFKVKGIKFILDGSIQGYTAFLNKPYEVLPPSGDNHNTEYLYAVDRDQNCTPPNCGIQSYKNQAIVNEIIATAYGNGVDVITHCNGDAAADQLIEAVKYAKNLYPNLAYEPRLIMIHAQTITNDQIDEMVKLNIHPSFFPAHTYYWGYDHNKTFLGPERAARIDPANSALKRNLRFTLHNDACVTPLQPHGAFEIMWTAVNRLTEKENLTLGAEQKIPVLEALKAVTINAAWQAREEANKGSLEVGKDADFIIVSDNPLTIDPYLLRKITVLQTIKDGQILFTHENYSDSLQNIVVQQQPPKRQELRRM